MNLRNKAISATWNIGAVEKSSNVALSTIKSQEVRNTATFKIGLMNVSDYIEASLDTSCQNDSVGYSESSKNCRNNNWLFDASSYYPWTINPWTTDDPGSFIYVWRIGTNEGHLSGMDTYGARGVRPVAYIASNNTVTSGTGTYANPWVIQ